MSGVSGMIAVVFSEFISSRYCLTPQAMICRAKGDAPHLSLAIQGVGVSFGGRPGQPSMAFNTKLDGLALSERKLNAAIAMQLNPMSRTRRGNFVFMAASFALWLRALGRWSHHHLKRTTLICATVTEIFSIFGQKLGQILAS